MPLADRGLVDVAGEDQVGAGLDEPGQHVIPAGDGLLARAPGRADQVVVEDDDLERRPGRLPQALLGLRELARPQAARLVPPGSHGVEADDVQGGGRVCRLGRLPLPFELAERTREARGERVRDVVVPRDREHRRPERAKEPRGARELVCATAVAEIAACDHELRSEALDQNGCAVLDRIVVACAEMQVGEVQNACKHGRSRL